MTSAIFFKELSEILDIPSLQYIFSSLKFLLNKVQCILVSRENTLVYNLKSTQKNCRQTKVQSIIKCLDSHFLNSENKNAKEKKKKKKNCSYTSKELNYLRIPNLRALFSNIQLINSKWQRQCKNARSV